MDYMIVLKAAALAVLFVMGFIAGRLSLPKFQKEPVGEIHINMNDPARDLMTLQFYKEVDLEDMIKSKCVFFNVDTAVVATDLPKPVE